MQNFGCSQPPFLFMERYLKSHEQKSQIPQSKSFSGFTSRQTNKFGPLIVCLDLDSTLIKASLTPPILSDFIIEMSGESGKQKIFIQKRPNFDRFITTLTQFAKVYLFSSAEKKYVKKIIENIDPLGKYFSKIFCRDSCICIDEDKYVKDLTVCNTNLSRTILVDDNPQSFLFQKNNGIQILPFNGNCKDSELNKVLQILGALSVASDVRPILEKLTVK